MIVTKGSTDVSVTIKIIDSTDGTPETGVVAATTGLVLNYRRDLAANVSLATITNLAALTTAHTDKGILHIGNGYYRVDVPDAAFATGVNKVLIHGVADGMIVIGNEVDLVDVDLRETNGRVDVGAIAGSAAAATGLSEGAQTIITGSVDAAGTAEAVNTDLPASGYTTDNALNGRIIIFDGNETAALKGLAASIIGYNGTTGVITLSASAITTAPVATGSADSFQIA